MFYIIYTFFCITSLIAASNIVRSSQNVLFTSVAGSLSTTKRWRIPLSSGVEMFLILSFNSSSLGCFSVPNIHLNPWLPTILWRELIRQRQILNYHRSCFLIHWLSELITKSWNVVQASWWKMLSLPLWYSTIAQSWFAIVASEMCVRLADCLNRSAEFSAIFSAILSCE